MADDSLITVDEADRVIQTRLGFFITHRNIFLVVIGVLIVVVATILVMIILSLRGARTGLESILPFMFDKHTEIVPLQTLLNLFKV